MEPSTLERALHMWPEWGESIHRAREHFNFTPTPPSRPDIWDWKWVLEKQQEVFRFGLTELNRLKLPKGLLWYWQCCFYADYERPDGSVDYDAIVDWLGIGVKVYPSLWAIDYQPPDSAPGTIRIEANIDLLSKRTAARLLDEIVGYQRHRSPQSHPLLGYIDRAKVRPEEKKRRAVSRFRSGEASFADLLKEEFADGDVQAELSKYHRRYTGNPQGLAKSTRMLRKEVYNRVYGWLRSAGITPPRVKKGEW